MSYRFKFQFKSSRVQGFNRILFSVLFLTLELLNPLNLELASAQQTPFYQDKSVRIVVGFTPGGLLRPLGPALITLHAQVYSRQS